MLYPNTQAVTNGYSTGWGPRPFSPKRAEIWIWGLEKCIHMKRGVPTPFFVGKMGKKVYEKRGKQVFVLTNWRFIDY